MSSRLVDRYLHGLQPSAGLRRTTAGGPHPDFGPVLVPIEDTAREIEMIDEVLRGEAGATRPRTSWLQRRRRRSSVGLSDHGVVQLDGRMCCAQLARSLDRRIAHLVLPYTTECPGCGARYRLEMGVRHGR